MKCCNNEVKLQKGKSETKGDYVFYKCDNCGRHGVGATEKQARNMFESSHAHIDIDNNNSLVIQTVPKNRKEMTVWVSNNMPALLSQSAQFIDKPATKRMIEKNMRYAMNLKGNAWDKVWSSAEGQESITNAITDANYHGATLGEMGDLVPYGKGAEFIANKECYDFALTTGNNAPLSDIRIESVHENDQTSNSQKDDNFIFEINRGIPRGECLAIVCTATRTDNGKRIGKIYDADRLMKKAFEHSSSYQSYIVDKENFEKLRVEGKLLKDSSGREYMEKKFSSWTKKIYDHDIVSPYAGADQVEMLEKMASKSFLRPFMKTRNATAMADEWEDDTENVDPTPETALSQASKQFENIVEAEIVEEQRGSKKEESVKNEKDELDEL